MVSAENLFGYPDCKIIFMVHTYASDKQLVDVNNKNNKPIVLLSKILSNPQNNYSTSEKELLVIVEFLKKFHRIIFDYKINVSSYHKKWSMSQP